MKHKTGDSKQNNFSLLLHTSVFIRFVHFSIVTYTSLLGHIIAIVTCVTTGFSRNWSLNQNNLSTQLVRRPEYFVIDRWILCLLIPYALNRQAICMVVPRALHPLMTSRTFVSLAQKLMCCLVAAWSYSVTIQHTRQTTETEHISSINSNTEYWEISNVPMLHKTATVETSTCVLKH